MLKTPLFSWLKNRGAGVLLHPTSLPGDYGIGTLGLEACRFVDFLAAAGMKYWQVCPLGPTGFGDSPYQCFSALAGNPYLIDLEGLMTFDLLKPDHLRPLRDMPGDRVDFGELYLKSRPVLRLAQRNFVRKKLSYLPNYGLYEDFKAENADWLETYALFMALKEHFGGRPWFEWEALWRSYSTAQPAAKNEDLQKAMEVCRFSQYLFFGQWKLVKKYARERGIGIIGDIPLFVSLDSADVWSQPEIFQLEKSGLPRAVAGVPPDYFSATGQLWGNPLYDWEMLKKNDYQWWMERLGSNFEMFDIVRFDHFRGLETYWSIPAGSKDATVGKWVKGPGLDFFSTIKKQFPDCRLMAEDLGEITPQVRQLLAQTGLPGMAVMQFAFDGNAANPYLPFNLNANSVLYPGTHDNDTTHGWYETASKETRHQARSFLRAGGEEISWDFIREAYRSVSCLAIIPMQDLLSLGTEARMNTPGASQGNWQWRFSRKQLDQLRRNSAAYLKENAEIYGRARSGN